MNEQKEEQCEQTVNTTYIDKKKTKETEQRLRQIKDEKKKEEQIILEIIEINLCLWYTLIFEKKTNTFTQTIEYNKTKKKKFISEY